MGDENNNTSKAGMIGLMIGFAAGALTVILSDPDNRKKVKESAEEALDTTREKAGPVIDKVTQSVKETASKIRASVNKSASEVKEEIDETESKLKNEG